MASKGIYEAEHRDAFATISAEGDTIKFIVTTREFNRANPSRPKVSYSKVSGVAMQVRGDPAEYQRLNLIEKASKTLLVVTDSYGESPSVGAKVEWRPRPPLEKNWVVESVKPVAPDGVAIMSRVIISR